MTRRSKAAKLLRNRPAKVISVINDQQAVPVLREQQVVPAIQCLGPVFESFSEFLTLKDMETTAKHLSKDWKKAIEGTKRYRMYSLFKNDNYNAAPSPLEFDSIKNAYHKSNEYTTLRCMQSHIIAPVITELVLLLTLYSDDNSPLWRCGLLPYLIIPILVGFGVDDAQAKYYQRSTFFKEAELNHSLIVRNKESEKRCHTDEYEPLMKN